jgi:hypothetical protein
MDVLAENCDLNEMLAADKDGRSLHAVADHLEGVKRDLKKSLDKGLPAKDFAVLDNLRKACDAAESIMRHAWSRVHQ